MIKDITPVEAFGILERDKQAVLLDVRARVEFEYVGRPVGAVNVPWQEYPEWRVDAQFVDHVREALASLRPGATPEDVPVLAMCRSGKRSEAAAAALDAAGFRSVYNVLQGFEGDRDGQRHRSSVSGWRFHGLPWEQS